MDKKLKRVIGYVRPEVKQVVPKPVEAPVVSKGIDLSGVALLTKEKSKKITKWINEHEEFKWGTMCTKLNIDRGNFQRILKSDNPNIKLETIIQIESFLTSYGYA